VERSRLLVLVLGPIIIVAASTAGALVTKRGDAGTPPDNRFLVPVEYPAPQPYAVDADLAAACRERARRLRAQLEPGDAILVEPPFVIAGKLTEAELAEWHREVILPAAAAMRASYFTRPPDAPVTLILLGDEPSYLRYAGRLAGEPALDYFGYYDSGQRTAVANLAAGEGTLLHELTHALMEFDFPQAPEWFAEGLASLHEQCRLRRDGLELVGLDNWRGDELRTSVAEGRLPSLDRLVATGGFRGDEQARNYAHARFLLLFLQSRGDLRTFYRSFRDRSVEDPTGLAILKELVEPVSREPLDRSFRRWIARWQTSDVPPSAETAQEG
jgi:hypothetical protein